jgi:alpha-ribazole phosphatase
MAPLVSCDLTKQKHSQLERQKPTVPPAMTELLLIRHAPVLANRQLAGRSDVPADCSDLRALAGMRSAIGAVEHRIMSPALRCAQTAAALWPDLPAPETDARLWEQDFGDWELMPYADLPDLGPLPREALAKACPPRGESFADLCARALPALETLSALGGRVAVVAHAGTVRAALSMALETTGAALAFQLSPLSLTRLTSMAGGGWSIGVVNWTVPGARSTE